MTLPAPAQPGPDPQLRQWLIDARQGSPSALGRLLDSYRVYLLQIANDELGAELHSKAGGSDLVQQTYLEAQRDFGQFDGTTEGELLAWLRCILRNNIANFSRQFGTAKRDARREIAIPEGGSSVNPLGQLPDAGPSPSSQAVAREEVEALERALARLPEEYRQVIVLHNRERRSFEEIGQVMNRSAEAVRKLWTRAIDHLERELGPQP